MNAKNRKLCPNCEGSVHIHATKCSYCGTDLVTQSSLLQEAPPPQFAPRSVAEAPPAPYSPYSIPRLVEERAVEPEPQAEGVVQPVVEAAPVQTKSTSPLLPMFLLIPGVFFLLFGMIMFLFSRGGVLSLSWDAHYWFVYLGGALPLLYYGWRLLQKVEEDQEESC